MEDGVVCVDYAGLFLSAGVIIVGITMGGGEGSESGFVPASVGWEDGGF